MSTDSTTRADATRRMLEARSIAVVGASDRPGSFGDRLTLEVLRSPSSPTIHLIHPKYQQVHGLPCVPSLSDVDGPVDLVLLGVPDSSLVEQLSHAAARGDGGAVVFGSAHGLGPELAATAHTGGLALCGGGCMGFVNVTKGIRAIGYVERHPLAAGPIALVTHSGSVFSALLRTHRRLEFNLAVSAGQELVTTASDYLHYALELDETRVVGLFLETLRDADDLRAELARAAQRDIAVVALTVGGTATGRAMVTAHSQALAGDDGAWEALFSAYGVHRVADLDEMVDTLELFAIGRRATLSGGSTGIATLHDSGGERALVADVAEAVGVPFATLGEETRARLSAVLDSGLEPTNPLDVWGSGANTEDLFTVCMEALADDANVAAIALAIDLVEEYDGDDSYPRALENQLARTTKPLAVLSNVASALDQVQADQLRSIGIPVLEGTHSGLRALKHLCDQAAPPATLATAPVDGARQGYWRRRLSEGPLDSAEASRLLADYGVSVATRRSATSAADAVVAADAVGYPVVLKTAATGIEHKADVDGVRVGLADADAVSHAYLDVSRRLGPAIDIQPQVEGGVELALGVVRDPMLGPLVLFAIGGSLVEVVDQRRVALPPLSTDRAEAMIDSLPVAASLLAGVRGRSPCDRQAVVRALVSVGQLAVELGDFLDALDVNPLICTLDDAVAVDVLTVIPPRDNP